MDCARDAAEIEEAARAVGGVESVRVSVASQVMIAEVRPSTSLAPLEEAVEALGYSLDPIDARRTGPSRSAHITPGYRRALWAVVLLNGGYGVIEMIGGVLSDSQALKADALDFLGDGLITLLGLLAIAWSDAWRARAALVQGLFLGALGIGVIATTAYRIVSRMQPEAELMGAFGAVALAVNVAAALLLVPHRTGDTNVRAVWLFSRNDAIGNLAVVIAAALVGWTGSAWPDLIVAFAIAALFLHSSWVIVRDAWGDLRTRRASCGLPASRTEP